jgi:hypothetical protein
LKGKAVPKFFYDILIQARMRGRVEITPKSKAAVRLDDVLWMKDHKIILLIFRFLYCIMDVRYQKLFFCAKRWTF